MLKYFNSEIVFPIEISKISQETVLELEIHNYFEEHFEEPEQAKTLFYEKLCYSLIPKFLKGNELFWCDQEFEKLIIEAGIDQSIMELENLNLIHVFDCENNDKIIVRKLCETNIN